MKNVFKPLIAAVFLAAALVSCKSDSTYKVKSTGAPYDVTVISSRDDWDGAMGDTLRGILLEQVEMLNQREPLFDTHWAAPGTFNGLAKKLKNIIYINVTETDTVPSMSIIYDQYAKPQAVVYISGKSSKEITEYIASHGEELVQIFELTERNRLLDRVSKYNEEKINALIKEKFGFDMSVPQGYTVRNTANNFLWISFELPLASQGIVIYQYPYSGKSDFEMDSLISKRDRFVSLIPGPSEGSHMKTSVESPEDPILRYKRINGQFWAELRSFWDVEGDFMGGPFVSYSTLDAKTRMVICIDCYVLNPNGKKRNFVRQLENLIYTVRFPAEAIDITAIPGIGNIPEENITAE